MVFFFFLMAFLTWNTWHPVAWEPGKQLRLTLTKAFSWIFSISDSPNCFYFLNFHLFFYWANVIQNWKYEIFDRGNICLVPKYFVTNLLEFIAQIIIVMSSFITAMIIAIHLQCPDQLRFSSSVRPSRSIWCKSPPPVLVGPPPPERASVHWWHFWRRAIIKNIWLWRQLS